MPAHFPSMVRACGDFRLYNEIVGQRGRRTAGYLTLLILVSSLLITVGVWLDLRKAVKEIDPEIDNFPTVVIKDHQASANVPQPWVKSFADPNSGLKTIIAIDTTGQRTGFNFDEQGFILTKTQLLVKNPQNPYLQPLDLAQIDDVTVDPTLLRHWIAIGMKILVGVVAVVLPLWFACAKLIQALLLSLVGLIVNSTRRRRLSYGTLFTLSVYALTPAIVLDVLRSLFLPNMPLFWLLYLGVGCAFVVLGVKKVDDLIDPVVPVQNQPPPPVGGMPGV